MSGGLFDGLPARQPAPPPATLAKPDKCACGARDPAFGFAVSVRKGRIGRWSCGRADCRARAERGER